MSSLPGPFLSPERTASARARAQVRAVRTPTHTCGHRSPLLVCARPARDAERPGWRGGGAMRRGVIRATSTVADAPSPPHTLANCGGAAGFPAARHWHFHVPTTQRPRTAGAAAQYSRASRPATPLHEGAPPTRTSASAQPQAGPCCPFLQPAPRRANLARRPRRTSRPNFPRTRRPPGGRRANPAQTPHPRARLPLPNPRTHAPRALRPCKPGGPGPAPRLRGGVLRTLRSATSPRRAPPPPRTRAPLFPPQPAPG